MKLLILKQVTIMSNAIIPEIVGQTEILEESPMTPQELQRKVELETIFKSADLSKDAPVTNDKVRVAITVSPAPETSKTSRAAVGITD